MSKYIWFLTALNLFLFEPILCHQKESNFYLRFKEIDYVRETLRGSHIKIHSMNVPPIWIIVKNNENSSLIEYKGTAVDIANYFARHYELILEFVLEDPSEVSKFGQTQALINAIVSEKVDFGLYGMTPSTERLEQFDMTSPSAYSTFRIMVRWPEEISRLTEVARPFDWITWTMIAITFVFIVGLLSLSAYFGNRRKLADSTNSEGLTKIIGEKIMYVFGITTYQGQSMRFINSKLSIRFTMGIWLLLMVVLLNSYTGVLTSIMGVPKLKPVPQSLEELAAKKEYKVTVMKESFLAKQFLSAKSGPYKVLGDTLRQYPELLFSKSSQAVENVLNFNAANVDASRLLSFRMTNDSKLNGKCRLASSNPISHAQAYSQILPKNSRLTKILDEDLWRMVEVGLYQYWNSKQVAIDRKCSLKANEDKKQEPKALKFSQLSSTFFMLSIGLSWSFVVFLIERSLYYGKKRQNPGKERIVVFSHAF